MNRRRLWESKKISLQLKIKIFNAVVQPVLLYSEVHGGDEDRVEETGCVRDGHTDDCCECEIG